MGQSRTGLGGWSAIADWALVFSSLKGPRKFRKKIRKGKIRERERDFFFNLKVKDTFVYIGQSSFFSLSYTLYPTAATFSNSFLPSFCSLVDFFLFLSVSFVPSKVLSLSYGYFDYSVDRIEAVSELIGANC